jgi:hypothetical protein
MAIATLIMALLGMAAAYALGHQGGYKQGQLDAVWACTQKH